MPYFPQSHPEFNFLRHLLLLYGDARQPWTEKRLLHSVVHLDSQGRPDDWLFDSFLFLNVKAGSGRDLCPEINLGTTLCGEGDFFAVCSREPANKEDWDELLEFYLGEDGAIRTLDRTLAAALAAIGRPYGRKRNVVLMVPYPHITQPAWGRLVPDGPVLDFSIRRQNLMAATEQRLAASAWLVDEIARRFEAQSFDHVHLLGLYWMFETVHRGWDVDDHWLLKELRRHIHRRGSKFLWIPFWSAYNVHLLEDYRSYYFDLAFLQPNYMFYKEGKSLEAAAAAARRRGTGLEIEYYLELDEPIRITGERQARLRDYLNGGLTYGYMREAACAHFQGVAALERMRVHRDPVERELYEDLYHFVKGDYQRKPALPRSPEGVSPLRVALAVDLGGTNLRAALVDDFGRIHERRAVATPKGRQAILSALLELVEQVRGDGDRRGFALAGIGVSTGGRVDSERGLVMDSTALLEGWASVPLGEILANRFGLRVRVDNDGHCAALAERLFGKGQDVQHFVSLTVGSGIGGGVVADGVLLRGASNAAAEFGHLSIEAEGPACSCGNRGCVELFASGSGLAARARDLISSGALSLPGSSLEQVDAQCLGRAAAEGNATARQLIEDAGRSLGIAVSGLLAAFNPQRVILGGSVLRLGESYLAPLRETVATRSMKVAREAAEIVVSDLEDPGLLGAAALVLAGGHSA